MPQFDDDIVPEDFAVEQDPALEAVETPIEVLEDGMRRVRVTVRHALCNRRLDKYLAGRLGNGISRTALQRYISEGSVTVNSQTVKCSYVIRSGDVIDMTLPEIRPKEIPAEPIPLDVVYEDDYLMAINKQADLIVHPARGNWTGTLVNALAHYFRVNWRSIDDLPTSGQPFRPGIVHRLDRDTTGIMLIAKTEFALRWLSYQFQHRKVHKTYTAIVHGIIGPDEDIIDAPIGKHHKIREKYAVHRRTGRPYAVTAKRAITRYKVLRRLEGVGASKASFTLVELYPETGRTHQLRVHMSCMNHPIVGDRMYGGGPVYRSQLMGSADQALDPLITRQALHAHTIRFAHPCTRQQMTLEAPWASDFAEALKELQSLQGAV